MKNEQWFELYKRLPYNSKCQVQHLIIHLIHDAKKAGVDLSGIDQFGTIMADDFDAPMKEFHDYMYHLDIALIEKIEQLPLQLQHEIESTVDEMLKDKV